MRLKIEIHREIFLFHSMKYGDLTALNQELAVWILDLKKQKHGLDKAVHKQENGLEEIFDKEKNPYIK